MGGSRRESGGADLGEGAAALGVAVRIGGGQGAPVLDKGGSGEGVMG